MSTPFLQTSQKSDYNGHRMNPAPDSYPEHLQQTNSRPKNLSTLALPVVFSKSSSAIQRTPGYSSNAWRETQSSSKSNYSQSLARSMNKPSYLGLKPPPRNKPYSEHIEVRNHQTDTLEAGAVRINESVTPFCNEGALACEGPSNLTANAPSKLFQASLSNRVEDATVSPSSQASSSGSSPSKSSQFSHTSIPSSLSCSSSFRDARVQCSRENTLEMREEKENDFWLINNEALAYKQGCSFKIPDEPFGEIPRSFHIENGANVASEPTLECFGRESGWDVAEDKRTPSVSIKKMEDILNTCEPLMKVLRGVVDSYNSAEKRQLPLLPSLPLRPIAQVIDKVQACIELYEGDIRLLSPNIDTVVPKGQWYSHVELIAREYTTTYNVPFHEGSEFGIILKDIEYMAKGRVLSKDNITLPSRRYELGNSMPTEIDLLWNQFWSGRPNVVGQASPTSLRLLALALSHLDARLSLPRRIPCDYRHHDQKLRVIWSDQRSPPENAETFKAHFTQVMEPSAPVCFLETWIEKSRGEIVFLELIAETLLGLWKCSKRCKEFEGLTDIPLGHLAATIIRSSSSSLEASASGFKILSLVFRLACRKMDTLIFKATICRLEKHDIVLAFAYFSGLILSSLSDDENEARPFIWDMFTDIETELWLLEKRDDDILYDWVRPVRTCLHIVLYLASHMEWFEKDQSIFTHLSQAMEDQIGKRGVETICDAIGFRNIYERMRNDSNIGLGRIQQHFKRVPVQKSRQLAGNRCPVSDVEVSKKPAVVTGTATKGPPIPKPKPTPSSRSRVPKSQQVVIPVESRPRKKAVIELPSKGPPTVHNHSKFSDSESETGTSIVARRGNGRKKKHWMNFFT